nr:MAG TPA: hypothetical protein [Caudoviricetes sp.]
MLPPILIGRLDISFKNKKYLEFRISIFYCAYILAYLTFFVNIFTKNL